MVFIDESGFQLLPGMRHTYAPVGKTPVLKSGLWKKLSAISAITSDYRLIGCVQEGAFNGESIVSFLRQLAEEVKGKIMVIWDGLPAHRGKAVRTFLSEGGAKRFRLERLPGYAPELNPDEGVWNYLKNVILVNQCFKTTDELKEAIENGLGQMSQRPDLLAGFIRQTSLIT